MESRVVSLTDWYAANERSSTYVSVNDGSEWMGRALGLRGTAVRVSRPGGRTDETETRYLDPDGRLAEVWRGEECVWRAADGFSAEEVRNIVSGLDTLIGDR